MAAVIGLSSPSNTGAALIAYEPFDYPAGTELMGQNGGTGWADEWGIRTLVFGPPPPGYYTIGAGNLAGPPGLPTLGNHGYFLGQPAFPPRDFGRMFPNIAGVPGSSTWISFLGQRVGEATDPDNTIWPNNPYPRSANLSFFDVDATANPLRTERIGIGNASTSTTPDPEHYDEWSLIPEGRPANRQGVADHSPKWSELAWAVVRIEYVGDHTIADNIWLWLNPDPQGPAPRTSDADVAILSGGPNSFDYSSLDLVRPFAGNADGFGPTSRPAAAMVIDEIRIGTTWLDVNGGVPEPSSGALFLLASLAIVARWPLMRSR